MRPRGSTSPASATRTACPAAGCPWCQWSGAPRGAGGGAAAREEGEERREAEADVRAVIDALAAIGRKDEARELFERILARRNHLGLLSEDLAFDNGEAWGNFPQTYSHVGLIIAAMRLSRSWQEAS